MSCQGCEYENSKSKVCDECLEDLHEYRKWTPKREAQTSSDKEENPNSAEILNSGGMSLLEVIKAYPEQVEKAIREHNIFLPYGEHNKQSDAIRLLHIWVANKGKVSDNIIRESIAFLASPNSTHL